MEVLDLFSGAAGGWSLGLHRAGYRTIAAAEADPWRRAAFLSNFPGVEMWEDVRAVTAGSLQERLGCLPDIVVGSPPCQDASCANQKGQGLSGERTGLFFEAVRIVREVTPIWCAFENSPGVRARGIDRVLSALEEAGYAPWPLVVGAVHAGAPHRRNRAWIIATDARCQSDEPFSTRLYGDAKPDWTNQRGGLADSGIWDRWNGGWLNHSGRMDDGLSPGMARRLQSAYGDAVVPQITEAIGRVMSRLMSEVRKKA